jgi:GR25 family glycosyltransferase involved in LPS biosynthesis
MFGFNWNFFEKKKQVDDNEKLLNFDWEFYINYYSDLKKSGINNKQKAQEHWLSHGFNENRIGYKKNILLNFDWTFYINLYNDLKKNGIDNERKAQEHWMNHGIYENRIGCKNDNLQYFDWKYYIEIYDDLKLNGIDNEKKANDHWLFHGKKENRLCSSDLQFVKKHINVNEYTLSYGVEDGITRGIIPNKKNTYINLFHNITFYVNEKNTNIELPDHKINYFHYDEENSQNKIVNNLPVFEMAMNSPSEYIIIINNKDIGIDYFKYHNKSFLDIYNKFSHYDIVELSIVTKKFEFYNIIEKPVNIILDNTFLQSNYEYNCYFITKTAIKKIIENNNRFILNHSINNIEKDNDETVENNIMENKNNKTEDNKKYLLENCKIGYYTRPLFNYIIKDIEQYNLSKLENLEFSLSKTLWDTYYRSTFIWDKTYCINLGFDIEKRNNMLKYCNLLNIDQDDFFYKGIFGLNLPDIKTLVTMNIYHKSSINKDCLRKGTIGLNITQQNIIKNCVKENYKYVLFLQDDVYFDNDYFITIDSIFMKYTKIDILYFGYINHETQDINHFFDKIYTSNNYNIYKPKELNKKIKIAGFFAVLMSNKALKLYLSNYTPISNVSDVLLCNMSFNIRNDFYDPKFIKTKYNLNSYFIDKNLMNIIKNKHSLTEENSFSFMNITNNKYIKFLSKIKILKFKMSYNYQIKIFVTNHFKMYYKNLLNILLNKFDNYVIVDYLDETIDIVLYLVADEINLNNKNINICINGENIKSNELTDIDIVTCKHFTSPFNIYFPQLFSSLWERRSDYKKIMMEQKNKINSYKNTQINVNERRSENESDVKLYKHSLDNLQMDEQISAQMDEEIDSQPISKIDEKISEQTNEQIKNKKKFCAYMYSYDIPYRVELFHSISKYKKVDSLGKSCNNDTKKYDRDTYNNDETYNDIAVNKYAEYKFVLALENSIKNGYVTEKIINPILANSIPIYAGPEDIFEFINKKRVIYVYDFPDYEELLKYIEIVDNDDSLYNKIIDEPIFINNFLHFDNFESYISHKLDKAFSFSPKRIYINNNINYNDSKAFNYIVKYIDFIITDIKLPYNDIKTIHHYLSDFIEDNDIITKDLQYDLDKINFIDHIAWINLDRSSNRRNHMNELLNNITIPNTRISAIDGNNDFVRNIVKDVTFENKLSNYEIGCTLSHLKAIDTLKKMKGDYFAVFEDDITFDNLLYFNKNLGDIIVESPEFDILIISKNFKYEMPFLYVSWSEFFNNNIYGTQSYIISRSGLEKIGSYFEYINDSLFIFYNHTFTFDVADIYLYKIVNTIIYKYNFINLMNQDSTINNEYIEYSKECCKIQTNIIKKDMVQIEKSKPIFIADEDEDDGYSNDYIFIYELFNKIQEKMNIQFFNENDFELLKEDEDLVNNNILVIHYTYMFDEIIELVKKIRPLFIFHLWNEEKDWSKWLELSKYTKILFREYNYKDNSKYINVIELSMKQVKRFLKKTYLVNSNYMNNSDTIPDINYHDSTYGFLLRFKMPEA